MDPASQAHGPDNTSHANGLVSLETGDALRCFHGLARAPPGAWNALRLLFHLVNTFSSLRSKSS